MRAMLQCLELLEDGIAVEGANVARLGLREAADRPREMHEMRLDRMGERMHPDLLRESVALARVAGRAGGNDVRPVVAAATRDRDDVITGERLARTQLGGRTAA